MEVTQAELANQVLEKLQEVEDPELLVDVVNLGLIYGIDLDAGHCTVTMTLTTMGCPLSAYLDQAIKKAVLAVPGIDQVEIKVVWYPVWSVDRMSDSAKRQLGIGEETEQKKQEKVENSVDTVKQIDCHTPIKTFADKYPSFADDMASIGFDRIKIPGMLNTVGRVMNLKLGSQAMGFDLTEVKQKLEEKGYQVSD
ncbi:MAG: iron-sulfur cluster assembly protein [Lactobacillus equicursoris]|uniref:iron-sulfur cluster assembly protein n=1 Tax=Lactobacillus equicursoris TaxID=420645 RepID=UPI00242BA102|nr:iron-sulfur cluster assembly protein [Lactobacillus equicursoris]MDD6407019.1 iron-sulfur cluster assembly protein [Lactobacillus equicursoris]